MKLSAICLDKSGFASALTLWYKAHHRDLPWRNTQDAYAIWISETMLQQTQVRTVLDYYHRFMERYPTLQALAEAPIDDVLKLWEGLGYYARCRNLHKAAKQMMEQHQGQFPQTLEEAQALCGIGRSTAGAILSFAYSQSHPLLDGNVKRVLSRIFDILDDIQQASVINRLWEHSETLLRQSEEPSIYNQAIMELGATVCLPKNPRCLLCPVKTFCNAAEHGTQHERPVKAGKKPSPHYDIAVGVIWKDDRVLIQQRPAEGLLGGLWEFPGGKQEAGESLQDTVIREIQEELGLEVQVREPIITVKHAYTHFKITLHAFHCDYLQGTPEPKACQAWQWVSPEELPKFAFPKANKTVLEKVLTEWQVHPRPQGNN
jgi:A/G-specific adenine glycosylase